MKKRNGAKRAIGVLTGPMKDNDKTDRADGSGSSVCSTASCSDIDEQTRWVMARMFELMQIEKVVKRRKHRYPESFEAVRRAVKALESDFHSLLREIRSARPTKP